MELMFRPLTHYADFEGRSRRTEYWLFQIFKTVIYVVLWGVFAAFAAAGIGTETGPSSIAAIITMVLIVLAWLLLLVPTLAVQVRRFHDQGMGGGLALLNIACIIPYLNLLVGLAIWILMFLPGKDGPNQYGLDPRSPYGVDPRDHHFRRVFD